MTVTCPKCLTEAAVTLGVADGDTLHCPECDETYSLADVRAVIDSWARVMPWLLSHPARQPEAAAVEG